MRTLTMTPEQTAQYDTGDATTVVVCIAVEAMELANRMGETIFVETSDGRPVAKFHPQ